MTSGTLFYADQRDVDDLLNYLGVGHGVVLRPWPLAAPDLELPRAEVHDHAHVLVVSAAMGEPVFAGEDGPATSASAASRLFHRMNVERARAAGVERIVDLEASPVLFWKPSRCDEGRLLAGSIGTQSDQPSRISPDYQRWRTRVSSWIRRRGVPVWGLTGKDVRPDLDIRRADLTTIHALPGALRMLEAGARGR